MEKISSRDAVASRLKKKEAEISRHIEALQEEMSSTGGDVKHYLKKHPWLGLAGSVLAGVAVGLIAGKKSEKTRQKEFVDTYIERLAQFARESGASEREVGALLREALHHTMPPVTHSQPKSKSSGLSGKLFGIALDLAVGFAKKSLVNFLNEKASSLVSSEKGGEDESEF